MSFSQEDKDYLIRAITPDRQIRILAVRSTNLVEQAREMHGLSPLASAALGRTLTGAVLTASLLKSGHEVSLTIDGNGPLGRIIAEANYKGEVRGYVANPEANLSLNPQGKIDVAAGVGEGFLTVRKILGSGKPYEGSVELISGEIGEDLTYYFTRSEQIPSSVGLGVLVNPDLKVQAAGGFMVQLMPEAGEEDIELLENNIANLGSISRLIEAGKTPEDLIELVLGDIYYRQLEEKEIKFTCKCNKNRVADLISGLSLQDIEASLEEYGYLEIRCHFCNQVYRFDESEINDIIDENK